MNILLINQYSGNKGDRAVLYAICVLLKRIYPGCKITVSTSDAALWDGYSYYEDNGITFVPWGWDYNQVIGAKTYWLFLNKIKKYTFTLLRESYLRGVNTAKFFVNPVFLKAIKKSDIVISVGGHHFTTLLSRDLVSGINFDAMAVLSSKSRRMLCFSQSFGPFDFHNNRNETLTKTLLSKCVLMPREAKSQNELKALLGDSHNIVPTFESVLTLSKHIRYIPVENRENTIGIAVYCTQSRDATAKEKYQSLMADFCDHAVDCGFAIRFFPMEIKNSAPDDRNFIKEIINRTKDPEKCDVYDADMETHNHLKEVSRCKVFLGHKTHSTIFALATGTPLIALAYHPKTTEFLRQFDLKKNVFDDKTVTAGDLTKCFDNLIKELNEVSHKEYEKAVGFASQIEQDLKEAIDMLK